LQTLDITVILNVWSLKEKFFFFFFLCEYVCFETGSCYAAQAVLEFAISPG
jgi:hypothetical protein